MAQQEVNQELMGMSLDLKLQCLVINLMTHPHQHHDCLYKMSS